LAKTPTDSGEHRDIARTPPSAKRGLRWLRSHVAFGLILVVALYLLSINISVPWQAIHEDDGNLYTSAAMSHIRYGLEFTKGQDFVDPGAKVGELVPPGITTRAQYFDYYLNGPYQPVVYGDHPPLLGLTIAGSLLLFGYHFWAVRLVPIAFTLLGLVLFYALVSHLFGLTIARVATAFYVAFPMFAYFGRNVDHEAPTLCCALAMLTGYVHWREDGRRRWVALMVVGTVVGGMYGWPLLYFAVIVFVVDWLALRRASGTLLWATVIPAAITFVLVLEQIVWARGGDLASLRDILLFRVGGGGVQGNTSAIAWLDAVTKFNSEGFGAWSQLALPLAMLFVAGRASSEGWSTRVRLVAILGLFGLSHVVIFRNGSLYHAYWQFYFIPFYAVVLGWAAVELAHRVVTTPALRAAALVVLIIAAFSLNLSTIIGLYSSGNNPVVPVLDLWH
jgi:4-amino-4-deoxy-L-arabinose transferase-like glycosyltransferase